ncbi:hypothetical protein [Saccharothrix sp. Mg75]|uniref:hypothetical protein n=1 Tax=Saccharothrix sp. Mg75 TaxID=3445357 RepID=UPI003EF001C6
MSTGPDDQDVPHVENQNSASEGAHVDQQIGVHVGDTTIHHDQRTYHVNQGDPPERKLEVARNLLDAGAPRRAEEILDDLLRSGWTSTEWAYHYALAVVGERSFVDLTGTLLDRLKEARRICSAAAHDRWSVAFDVVWELLRWARRVYRREADSGRDYAFGLLEVLPLVRQEEIFRHLDAVIKDVRDEGWEADLKARMLKERTVPERRSQSEKFFEPDPAEPKPYLPPLLKPRAQDRAWSAVAVVGVLLGVLLLVSGPFRSGLLLELLLLSAGGYLVLRCGAVARLGNREQPAPPDFQPAGRFDRDISAMVDHRFRKVGPKKGTPGAEEWDRRTKGHRTHLKKRITWSYHAEDITPANVRWLVDWHAERLYAQWPWGGGAADRDVRKAVWGYRLGVVAALAGSCGALLAGELSAVLVLVPTGRLVLKHGVRVAATRHANRAAEAEAARVHREELDEHLALVDALRDRPKDAQIAWWYTLDKFYLVSDAIKRARLPRQEVVEVLVLTERAPFARRGRVQYGPPRYEAYNVHLLLLTHHGVRAFKVHLDAHTGEARNETRQVFSYDKIASAWTEERGVRTTTDGTADPAVENVKSGTFRMALMSGQEIKLKVDCLEERPSDEEAAAEFADVAYETSGVRKAIPVLESIVSEGENWILRDRERREQWARDWDETTVGG